MPLKLAPNLPTAIMCGPGDGKVNSMKEFVVKRLPPAPAESGELSFVASELPAASNRNSTELKLDGAVKSMSKIPTLPAAQTVKE